MYNLSFNELFSSQLMALLPRAKDHFTKPPIEDLRYSLLRCWSPDTCGLELTREECPLPEDQLSWYPKEPPKFSER